MPRSDELSGAAHLVRPAVTQGFGEEGAPAAPKTLRHSRPPARRLRTRARVT